MKTKPKAVTAGDIEFLSLRESSLRGRLIFLLLFTLLYATISMKGGSMNGRRAKEQETDGNNNEQGPI